MSKKKDLVDKVVSQVSDRSVLLVQEDRLQCELIPSQLDRERVIKNSIALLFCISKSHIPFLA